MQNVSLTQTDLSTASTVNPLDSSSDTASFTSEDVDMLMLEEGIGLYNHSHCFTPVFALKFTLPENAAVDPNDPSLLGTRETPGVLAQTVMENIPVDKQQLRTHLDALIESIRANEHRKSFAQGDECKKEYAFYCHQLAYALHCAQDQDARVLILEHFSELDGECKDGWDQQFRVFIMPDGDSMDPAIFTVQCRIAFRRSLVQVIRDKFADRVRIPFLDLRSSHFLKVAQQILNKTLELGFEPVAIADWEIEPFIQYKRIWNQYVTIVLEQYLDRENQVESLITRFSTLSNDLQDVLLQNLCHAHNDFVNKGILPEDLSFENIKCFLAYLPSNLSWKALIDHKNLGYEYSLQFPVKDEQQIECILQRELREQAMLFLKEGYSHATYKDTLLSMELDESSRVFYALKRLKRWESEDHETLAREWGFIPNETQIRKWQEAKLAKLDELRSDQFKQSLVTYEGGKLSLSYFGAYVLLASSGDLDVDDGIDMHQATILRAFQRYAVQLVKVSAEKGVKPSLIMQVVPKVYLTPKVVAHLTFLEPEAMAFAPVDQIDHKTALTWLKADIARYQYLPVELKSQLAFAKLAIIDQDLSTITSIVKFCPEVYEELTLEQKRAETIQLAMISQSNSKIEIVANIVKMRPHLLVHVDSSHKTNPRLYLSLIDENTIPNDIIEWVKLCPTLFPHLIDRTDPRLIRAAICGDEKNRLHVDPDLLRKIESSTDTTGSPTKKRRT